MSAGPVPIAPEFPLPVAIGAGRSVVAVRRWAGSWLGGVALVILCLSVYLPGLWAIPPVDRDESRFAQASRQMYESGDWVVPRVQSKPRLNKPPLIYWCQCAGIALFGDKPGQYAHGNIWVFRTPSILAALGAVLLTWRLGLRMFDPSAAWLGAAMLAVCPMVVWDAHQARADQLLLFCTTATQFALYTIWCPNSPSRREGAGGWVLPVSTNPERSEGMSPPNARRTLGIFINPLRRRKISTSSPRDNPRALAIPILFWLALSAGILTKGPITPMIAALTALSLGLTTRRWRWLFNLRPLLGVVIIAAATLPWLLALTHRLAHPTGDFRDEMQQLGLNLGSGESGWLVYLRIVYDETLGRSAGAKEGHWGPPGYHLILLTLLFWPGSLLTGLALARTLRRAFSGRHHPPAGRVVMGFPSRIRGFLSRLRSPNFHAPSRFLLCWLFPSWLVFELVSTKLPHYTMPLYPAIALISARALFAADRGVLKGLRDLGTRIGFFIWWLVGVAATLGLSILVIIAGRGGGDETSSILAALSPYALPGVIITLALIAAGRSLARGFYFRAQLLALAAIVLWGATFLQFILPGAQRFWISSRIARAIDIPTMPSDWRLGGSFSNATGFNEDSLVFLTRGWVSNLDDESLALANFSNARMNSGLLAIRADSPAAAKVACKATVRIEGWNYSNGMPVDMIIFERGRRAP